ncbi:WD40 repeat domain-containing serine/threonine protein kinase [Anthocerotibacter panamensis]|uniref:WD40 repeat domain-containing serine/threonine protein kinase n=1 Tax=Anthocerotibacter panamensis TaxID=2857077 RepID=UPI001C407D75|nr:protein kinase [Anthocerotibacter panamensis]
MDIPSPEPLLGVLIGGRYRVARFINGGGMGRVFEAADTRLADKTVAIKVLFQEVGGGSRITEQLQRRFEEEAQLSAILGGHPRIIQVTDYGFYENRPYLVMEYLGMPPYGQNFSELIRKDGAVRAERVVHLTLQICEGLHHAHCIRTRLGDRNIRGVVHRDVKPSNLFLISEGTLGETVKILDFGIAKALSDVTSILGTNRGFVGTSDYASPEQLRGENLDPRSDIYSLGIVLYQMLTGHMPLKPRTNSFPGWYHAHNYQEPIALSEYPTVQPIPDALVGVVMSCLHKDLERRPANMEVLSQLLQATLTGAPYPLPPRMLTQTQADPQAPQQQEAERLEQEFKSAQAELEAGYQQTREDLMSREQLAQQLAQQLREEQQEALARWSEAHRPEQEQWLAQRNAGRSAQDEQLKALQERETELERFYQTEKENLTQERTALEQQLQTLADEIAHYEAQIQREQAKVAAEYQKDLRGIQEQLNTLSQEQARLEARLQAERARLEARYLRARERLETRFTPPRSTQVPRPPEARTAPSQAPRPPASNPPTNGGLPEETVIRYRGATIRVPAHSAVPQTRPPADSRPTLLTAHEGTVWSLALSADGQTLVSAGADHTVKLWNVSTGQVIRTLGNWFGGGHSAQVFAVALGGPYLASGGLDRTIKIWQVGTGKQLRSLNGHTEDVNCLAFTPDGRHLVSGSLDRSLRVWQTESGRLRHVLRGHQDLVRSVAVLPDNRTVVSGSADRTIRFWDLETGESLRAVNGHAGQVWAIALTPDGQMVASGSGDRTIRLWASETEQLLDTLTGHNAPVYTLAFSRDGQLLASGSDNNIRLWDGKTRKFLGTLTGDGGQVWSLVFSPDRQTLVSGWENGKIRLYTVPQVALDS